MNIQNQQKKMEVNKTKPLSNKEIQNLVLLELMAPDPYQETKVLTEEESAEISNRYRESNNSRDWRYLLEPIKDPITKSRFISLLETLDKNE